MTKRRMKAPEIIDANMAHIERFFAENGAAGLARLIAARLRDPAPRREILDMVARLLDPHKNDELALVVKRRRRGETTTKWVTRLKDIRIAKEYEQELIAAEPPKRGSRKRARAHVAARLEISDGRVRSALRRILPLIPKLPR